MWKKQGSQLFYHRQAAPVNWNVFFFHNSVGDCNSICFWYIYRFWWWRGSVKSAVEYHRITCLVFMGTGSRITPDVLGRRTSYNLNQRRFLIRLKWWSDFKQIGIESKRWWSSLQQLASGWFGWFVFIRPKLTLRTSTSCASPGQGAIWQHFNLPEFPNKPKITQTTCPASLNNDFTSWWFVNCWSPAKKIVGYKPVTSSCVSHPNDDVVYQYIIMFVAYG